MPLSVRFGTDCHRSCPDRSYSDDRKMVCLPCEDKKCEICDESQCYWCEDQFYVFGEVLLLFYGHPTILKPVNLSDMFLGKPFVCVCIYVMRYTGEVTKCICVSRGKVCGSL